VITAAIATPAIVVAAVSPAVMVVMMMVMMTVVIFAVTPIAVAITVRSGVGSALCPGTCRQAEQPHAQNQLMQFV
jgi:hypothetical protein